MYFFKIIAFLALISYAAAFNDTNSLIVNSNTTYTASEPDARPSTQIKIQGFCNSIWNTSNQARLLFMTLQLSLNGHESGTTLEQDLQQYDAGLNNMIQACQQIINLSALVPLTSENQLSSANNTRVRRRSQRTRVGQRTK